VGGTDERTKGGSAKLTLRKQQKRFIHLRNYILGDEKKKGGKEGVRVNRETRERKRIEQKKNQVLGPM